MFQGSSVLEKVLGLSRVQIGEKFSCRYLVLGLGFCYSGPLKFWRAFLGWCRVQFSRVLFSEVFLIFQNTFRFFWAIFGLKILFLGLTEKITARELFSADFSFPFSCAFVRALLPQTGGFWWFGLMNFYHFGVSKKIENWPKMVFLGQFLELLQWF